MNCLKILLFVLVISVCSYSTAHTSYRVGDVLSKDYIVEDIRVYSHRRRLLSESQRENLLAIPGIKHVGFEKYETTVIKSSIYTWEEIIGAIFFILNEGR